MNGMILQFVIGPHQGWGEYTNPEYEYEYEYFA